MYTACATSISVIHSDSECQDGLDKLESRKKLKINAKQEKNLPMASVHISVYFYLFSTTILRLWILLWNLIITLFLLFFSVNMYYLEIKEAISKLLDVPDMVAQLVNFLFYEHNVLI